MLFHLIFPDNILRVLIVFNYKTKEYCQKVEWRLRLTYVARVYSDSKNATLHITLRRWRQGPAFAACDLCLPGRLAHVVDLTPGQVEIKQNITFENTWFIINNFKMKHPTAIDNAYIC